MNKSTVVASVAFATLGVALVLGIIVFGVDDSAIPFVTTVLGFLSLGVTQFVSAMKADKTETAVAKTEEAVTELNKDLRNGTFERLVREALTRIAEDPDTSLHITQNRKEDEGNGW